MSDTNKPHHLTNDDLGRRIGDLEQGLTTVLSEQARQGGRLDTLEVRWDWLTATLGRLLGRQEEIAERTQVILQRHDKSDEHLREVRREVRLVGGKVDALACAGCPPKEVAGA